jgi:hypothetical protein
MRLSANKESNRELSYELYWEICYVIEADRKILCQRAKHPKSKPFIIGSFEKAASFCKKNKITYSNILNQEFSKFKNYVVIWKSQTKKIGRT